MSEVAAADLGRYFQIHKEKSSDSTNVFIPSDAKDKQKTTETVVDFDEALSRVGNDKRT
jgi:hypothetical protein